jgi:predicted nucleic acid-binding protein
LKIIVDTNIVFSAILNSNSRIGKIFFTCNYLRVEIWKHRNRLLNLTRLTEEALTELEVLTTQRIRFIDERLLPRELLLNTETLLQSIDRNDTPFVAWTQHLEGKLWTGDMQLYNGLKARHFEDALTTAELSILLDDLERE